MRTTKILAGAAVLLGCVPATAGADVVTAASPPAGAMVGVSTQQGSWGQGGWQAGTGAALADAGVATAHSGKAIGGYKRPEPGKTLPQIWLNPDYTINDWQGWGLAAPAQGTRWVRYYDDAVLVDDGGKVRDARYAVDWSRGYHTVGYAGTAPASVPIAVNTTPRVTTVQPDANTVVTTSVVEVAPTLQAPIAGYAANGIPGDAAYAGYAGGGAQVVGYTPGTISTVTTTRTIPGTMATIAKVPPVRRKAPRRVARRPYCACGS
jgi:Ni/Co efflux regulator RcnB